MKLLTCTLPLIFTVLIALAQNHVPNASFEQYNNCPVDFSQFTNYCKDWKGYTSSTPDYFNSCNNNTVNVPSNFVGHQVAAHGNAYAGVFCFTDTALGSPLWKEYIETGITPLETGQSYDVSMYVSMADSIGFASDDLGVFFYSNGAPPSATTGALNVTPQISYSSYGPVTDKNNWVLLTASFVADSSYSHIIIGGFKSIPAINYAYTPPVGLASFSTSSYYYIDLIEIVKSRPKIIFNDTSLCGGDTVVVYYDVAIPSKFLPNNMFTLQLSDATGSFTNAISVATANSFMSGMMTAVIPKSIPAGSGYRLRLVASAPADTSFDNGRNIRITQLAPPVAVINTPVCEGDSLKFTGTAPLGSSYMWAGPQYAATSDSSFVSSQLSSGTYYVTAALHACQYTDTITVLVKPVPLASVSSNAPVCYGGELKLFASSNLPQSTFSWTGPGFSSSVQNPEIPAARDNEQGIYTVFATNDGCTSKPAQISIDVYDQVQPPAAIDTDVCRYTPFAFIVPAIDSIKWYETSPATNGSFTQPLISTNDTGVKSIYVANVRNGCESELTRITVTVKDKPYLELGADTTLCAEMPFRLSLGYPQPEVSYMWSTGDSKCCIDVRTAGTFTQTITNDCGSASDSVQVSVEKCDYNTCIMFPSAFTPNGDGTNDLFSCLALCPIAKYELRIYNRWGQQVFHTTDINGKWDGRYKGVPQDQGSFYYFARYIPDVSALGTLSTTVKGDVILVR